MFGYENIVDQTSKAKWSDFITKVFAALFLGGQNKVCHASLFYFKNAVEQDNSAAKPAKRQIRSYDTRT